MATSIIPDLDTSGIYQIINTVNGKRYIGSAVNLRQRRNEHWSKLARGIHHSKHFQSAWNRYGKEAFVFRVLLFCAKPDLLFYEQLAMDGIRPEYNVETVAGSSIGCIRTPETRAKISAKAKGRKRSEEVTAKIVAAMTGRKLSPEHRATLLGNKKAAGHTHTEEWKRQNSIRNTGVKRPKSPEQREKIAAALRGITHSPERRARQAAGQLGKKRGPYKLKPKII